jgi:opacity protein-like surface antigen
MKRFLVLAFALCCAAPAGAAMSPSSQVQAWLGTWSCSAAGNRYTQTFSPIFGGNGMRISETGKMPSEQLVTWDSKSQKWIDQFADPSGAYSTMQGTPSGATISFKQVYPPSSNGFTVTRNGNTYKSAFTGMMNGKRVTQRDTCTKR